MSKNFEVLQKLEKKIASSEKKDRKEGEFTEEIPERPQKKGLTADSESDVDKTPDLIITPDSIKEFAKKTVEVNNKLVDPGIVTITGEDAHCLEQYRSLRTKVLKMARLPEKNTILVTSSSAGEGKTITAINLALTIARGVHENVLLVDCDLRHPDIHKKLGMKTEFGLSHYLNSEISLSSILYKTNIPKLSIISGGDPQSLSSELLASERMKKLIQETKSRYKDRYIIFDTPPILPVTDPCVLVEQMDWAIFVVRAGFTSRKTIDSALSLFNREKILGIVMNNLEIMPQEYRQSYKGAYKYKYIEKKRAETDL